MTVFRLPKLSCNYDQLEPPIDARTLEIHYSKHHATYVNNLNSALEGYTELLASIDLLPPEILTAVQNNQLVEYCRWG